MLRIATPFADKPMLKPFLLDEFQAGSLIWKPMNEIDDFHDQNCLF